MLKITVNRQEAEEKLGRLATVGKDLDPVKKSARWLRAQIAQGFDEQRDPWGNAWVPLSDTTLGLRRRAGSASTKILVDSGEMRSSLRTRDDTVEIRPPAEYHQAGGVIRVFGQGYGILPRRPIMPINEQGEADLPDPWMDQIVQFFNDWLDRQ